MFISDVSVRRPVFAMVVSLLLVIFGLMALDRLSVREYPDIDPPVVSIDTTYRGASAAVVETKITQVIEDRIAGLEGIRKLTSTSSDERSRIRVEFGLNRDVDAAANDIRDRVARVVADLAWMNMATRAITAPPAELFQLVRDLGDPSLRRRGRSGPQQTGTGDAD